MKTKQVIKALSALAQKSRLAVFRLLVEAGPAGMAAGKIGETLDIPAATLSFHLKELSNAELLMSRQESRFVIYAANYPAMTELMGFLTGIRSLISPILAIVKAIRSYVKSRR